MFAADALLEILIANAGVVHADGGQSGITRTGSPVPRRSQTQAMA